MAKYDGLIIPRSYNDYINKSDPAGVAQALQLTGVMDNAPTAQSTKPAKSGGIFALNAVIMANNKTLSGVAISAGSVVRVLFTAALTGSDATTGLTLKYNGNTYAVKVGKNGALANFHANNIDGSYIYCQAYTTLELMFDGSQFVVMGNPVVISNADFSIMADGSIAYRTFYKDFRGSFSDKIYLKVYIPNSTAFLIQVRGGETVLVSGTNYDGWEFASERLVVGFDKLGGFKFSNYYMYFTLKAWAAKIRFINLLAPEGLPSIEYITASEYNAV